MLIKIKRKNCLAIFLDLINPKNNKTNKSNQTIVNKVKANNRKRKPNKISLAKLTNQISHHQHYPIKKRKNP
jgi:hypothetical protein